MQLQLCLVLVSNLIKAVSHLVEYICEHMLYNSLMGSVHVDRKSVIFTVCTFRLPYVHVVS